MPRTWNSTSTSLYGVCFGCRSAHATAAWTACSAVPASVSAGRPGIWTEYPMPSGHAPSPDVDVQRQVDIRVPDHAADLFPGAHEFCTLAAGQTAFGPVQHIRRLQ